MHKHSPILCILPPHMLKEIVINGTTAQREYALLTMKASAQMRGQRAMMAEFTPATFRVTSGTRDRIVYDARNGSSLPGTAVRRENDPASSDVAVNEAFDGSGATYDLFNDVYGRNSIDGDGMRLDSTVHYRVGYDNAFWDGQQMVYGDGDENLPVDERLFNRFTIAIDIMGHELTHGVTQFEAKLVYSQQPGALNEHMSDVFGSLVKQRLRGHTASQADWIIGEGLFTPNVTGVGIRSMKAPGTAYDDPVLGKDPQPAHMRDYVNTVSDNGGVHINSGIPNHAFYLAAIEMGVNAWEKAGQIWYVALRDKLSQNSNFAACANLTHQVAGELFGTGSLEQQAVKNGWEGVGLSVEGGGATEPGGGCLEGFLRFIGAAPTR